MYDDRNPGPPEGDHTGGYSAPGPYGGPGYGPPPPGPYQAPYQDPYMAQQPAYPPMPPPQAYPGYPMYPPLSKGGAIGALVTSILLMISCYGIFAAIGLVFSIIAVSETFDQEKVSRYTRYAWIANGVVIGLLLLLITFGVTMAIIGS